MGTPLRLFLAEGDEVNLAEHLIDDARDVDQAARHMRTDAGRRLAEALAKRLRDAADAERKREHREKSR